MIHELAQGIDGLVTIAAVLPGQALRTFAAIHKIPLGGNYYLEAPVSQGASEKSEVAKVLPYAAIGIAGLVAYKMFLKGR